MVNSITNLNNCKLNIAKLLSDSKTNGPGERFVIWLQGCSLNCKSCINPRFLAHEQRKIISVIELYNQIINTENIEGVTYSGGEPFEQAESLYYLSVLLKEKDLTIMSYSGFTYYELVNSKNIYVSKLLSVLDILIDGRYEEDKAIPLLWRSSKNQNVYFLTERYENFRKKVNQEIMELEMGLKNNSLEFTGNFNQLIISKVAKRLHTDFGIVLEKSDIAD